MNNKFGWILLIVLGLALLIGLPFLWSGRTDTGDYFGMMGPSMMGGLGSMGLWAFMGMAFMWLIPIGGLVLIVSGAVFLTQGILRNSNSQVENSQNCPNCSKSILSSWVSCPYCGEKL
ncbi:MAG TPA: hypothetical protein VLM80_07335 [Anaerolineales bacterium]|nr:hypothetical protein [Anaerolineales bacterium]